MTFESTSPIILIEYEIKTKKQRKGRLIMLLQTMNILFTMFILGLGRYEKVDRTTMIIAGIVTIINVMYLTHLDMKECEK